MEKKIELTNELLDRVNDLQDEMHWFIGQIKESKNPKAKKIQYNDAVTIFMLTKLSDLEMKLSKL